MKSAAPKLPSNNFLPKYFSTIKNWHGHIPFAVDLICAQKPRVIVELGTHYGDSYFTFCQACDEFSVSCQLYAIDHWNGDEFSGFYNASVYKSVLDFNNEHYSANSSLIKSKFIDAVNGFQENSIDILHIDGMHDYDSVKSDFLQWFSKVSDNGVILLHDINVYENNFGVYKLWEELKLEFLTLQYEYSYGLGVLFKGKEYDFKPSMLRFYNKSKTNKYREYYMSKSMEIINYTRKNLTNDNLSCMKETL